jgi:hypothetical protein
MTTAPIAGNQYYTGLSTQAAQLQELSIGDLVAGNVDVAGSFTYRTNVVHLEPDIDYQIPLTLSGTTFVLPLVALDSNYFLPTPVGNKGVNYTFVTLEDPLSLADIFIHSNDKNITGVINDVAGSAVHPGESWPVTTTFVLNDLIPGNLIDPALTKPGTVNHAVGSTNPYTVVGSPYNVSTRTINPAVGNNVTLKVAVAGVPPTITAIQVVGLSYFQENGDTLLLVDPVTGFPATFGAGPGNEAVELTLGKDDFIEPPSIVVVPRKTVHIKAPAPGSGSSFVSTFNTSFESDGEYWHMTGQVMQAAKGEPVDIRAEY